MPGTWGLGGPRVSHLPRLSRLTRLLFGRFRSAARSRWRRERPDAPPTGLKHVRHFVPEQPPSVFEVWRELTGAEVDVRAHGERAGVEGRGGP